LIPIEENKRGVALAILAGIIAGTAAIFTRSIAEISPIAIAASRLTLGATFMGILIGAQGHIQEFNRSRGHYSTFILLGIISSLHFVFFVLAVQKTFIANALILVNTAPILVLLLAPLLLRETITVVDVVCVAITFAGAGIIVGFDRIMFRPDHLLGDLCALGSAFCYALYVILARRLRQIYSSAVIMFWFFGLGAIFLWIGGMIIHDPFFFSPSRLSLLFLLLLGILPTGIGHYSYNLSLKYIPAIKASTIVLLEPVSGTLFALIFLSEIPPATSFLGIAIALIGIGMASLTRET
jgi:drug/metabolite transporter (DMT)-like permease